MDTASAFLARSIVKNLVAMTALDEHFSELTRESRLVISNTTYRPDENIRKPSPMLKGDRCRCFRCRRFTKRSTMGGEFLGLTGCCPECVQDMATWCEFIHGRLPRRGEFYCPGCQEIRKREERALADRTQKRLRCYTCRREQLDVADRRYQEKKWKKRRSVHRASGPRR